MRVCDEDDYGDDYDDNYDDDYATTPAEVVKTYSVCVTVAPDAIGRIIGSGHARLNALEAAHNCKIVFSGNQATITGTLLASLTRAKNEILAAVASIVPAENSDTVVLAIPCGVAIGKGGATIKHVQAMRVKVDVDKDNNTVAITGEKRFVGAAVQYYRELMDALFEADMEIAPEVRRTFAPTAETMFGVKVSSSKAGGKGCVTVRGVKSKVHAAVAYLELRERDGGK